MSRNITILQGGQYSIRVIRDDANATSVTFIMKDDNTEEVISITEPYVDGEAVIEIVGLYTDDVGVYSYQFNENLSGGGIHKKKAGDCFGDDCEFGKVIICESLDGVIS